MISIEGQHSACPKFLNVSVELQNIYFEVV
jgi:hypothetical protein